MKRIYKIFTYILTVTMLFSLTACGKKKEEKVETRPELVQIRDICELATIECYYHNVAKSVKSAGKGITHIGEKSRDFWIEYRGTAKIGIDLTDVDMKVDGNTIYITIPKAKVLELIVDETTYNADSFISSKDGWLNGNKITADDQREAMKSAENDMKVQLQNNSTLLVNARERAKKLIENYIAQISEATNTEYTIIWREMDDNGKVYEEVEEPR